MLVDDRGRGRLVLVDDRPRRDASRMASVRRVAPIGDDGLIRARSSTAPR